MLSPLALKKRKLHGFLFVEIALFIHTICRFFVYRFKIKITRMVQGLKAFRFSKEFDNYGLLGVITRLSNKFMTLLRKDTAFANDFCGLANLTELN